MSLFFILEDMEETSKKSDPSSFEDESVLNEIKPMRKPKLFYSELLSNFKSNYERWCDLLKQEQSIESTSTL